MLTIFISNGTMIIRSAKDLNKKRYWRLVVVLYSIIILAIGVLVVLDSISREEYYPMTPREEMTDFIVPETEDISSTGDIDMSDYTEEELTLAGLFTGINKEQIRKLIEVTKDLPEGQRLAQQQAYYEEALPILQARKNISNSLRNGSISNDPQLQKQIKLNYMLMKFKSKNNIVGADDEELLTTIISFNDEVPFKMADYINGINEDILYDLGLKERPDPVRKLKIDNGFYIYLVSVIIGTFILRSLLYYIIIGNFLGKRKEE